MGRSVRHRAIPSVGSFPDRIDVVVISRAASADSAVTDSFTHLHVHTEFSMLDGAARLDEMVAKAVADGQPAIGMTDHGNMYGTLEFYKECNKQGIKPIIGTEAYMAHDHRSERPARRGRIDDSGGDTEGGQEALLPPHAAGRERDRLPQPDPALEPGVPRGLLLQAADGLGAARELPRRADRHHRLPRRARAAGAAAGRREGGASTRPAGCRRSSARTTCSSSSRITGCRRSATPTRSWSRSPGASAPRCSPPTTRTTRTARTTSRTTRCCACRPGR